MEPATSNAVDTSSTTAMVSAAPPPYSPTGLSMNTPHNASGVHWQLTPEGYTPYVPEKGTLPPTTGAPDFRRNGSTELPAVSPQRQPNAIFHNSAASRSAHARVPSPVGLPIHRNISSVPISGHSVSSPNPGNTATHVKPTTLPRAGRRKVANETVSAISLGGYVWNGGKVELAASVQTMLDGVRVYGADAHIAPPTKMNAPRGQTVIEVVDLTALDALRRVSGSASQDPCIGLLISASPNGPHGSFREGDAGQEASVLRASTLSLALAGPFCACVLPALWRDRITRMRWYTSRASRYSVTKSAGGPHPSLSMSSLAPRCMLVTLERPGAAAAEPRNQLHHRRTALPRARCVCATRRPHACSPCVRCRCRWE